MPESGVRPTSERARQAYFNIVTSRLAGARFLDLFAGSGIFSFEAVSRGATSATAVELSSRQAAAIEAAARTLDAPVTVAKGDAEKVVARLSGGPFDLVYADPPYDYSRYRELLAALREAPLADDALIAIEHRRRTDPLAAQDTFEFVRRAEYGEVWISFFQRAGVG